jgi:hypothetical protein
MDKASGSGCVRSVFIRFVLPVVIGLLLVTEGVALVPAWSAKLGQGVHGNFTAENCDLGKGGCEWDGYFVADDGSDYQRDIRIGSHSGVTHVGQQIPAVDTGNPMAVYPAGGGTDWELVSLFFVLSLAAAIFWVLRVPVVALRAARSRREPEVPRPPGP